MQAKRPFGDEKVPLDVFRSWIWEVLNTAVFRIDCAMNMKRDALKELQEQAARQERFNVSCASSPRLITFVMFKGAQRRRKA